MSLNENDDEISILSKDTIPEFSFKVAVLGDTNVGKSSLVRYEVFNNINNINTSSPYLEVYWLCYLHNKTDKKIRLTLWDINDNQKTKKIFEKPYDNMYEKIMKNTYIFFIIFSMSNYLSLAYAKKYIEWIKNECGKESIIYLIGNKNDTPKETHIPEEKIKNFIEENKIIYYFETSAITGDNIHNLFKSAVYTLYLTYIEPIENDDKDNNNNNKIFILRQYQNRCKDCLCCQK